METTTVKTVFQFRRATTDEWEIVNPILREGEPAYDITAKSTKLVMGKASGMSFHMQKAVVAFLEILIGNRLLMRRQSLVSLRMI